MGKLLKDKDMDVCSCIDNRVRSSISISLNKKYEVVSLFQLQIKFFKRRIAEMMVSDRRMDMRIKQYWIRKMENKYNNANN